jgi:hypothetical protein
MPPCPVAATSGDEGRRRLADAAAPEAGAVGAAALLAGVGAQNSFAKKISRRHTAATASTATIEMAGGEGEGQEGTPEPPLLGEARSCYLCKCGFRQLHHFYAQLCPACAALNWRKRNQRADMQGRVALVTGGRVKIGFNVRRSRLLCLRVRVKIMGLIIVTTD